MKVIFKEEEEQLIKHIASIVIDDISSHTCEDLYYELKAEGEEISLEEIKVTTGKTLLDWLMVLHHPSCIFYRLKPDQISQFRHSLFHFDTQSELDITKSLFKKLFLIERICLN